MILGVWLIFTETYTTKLDDALLGPPKITNIERVDDAFFGYICSAKVSGLCYAWPYACLCDVYHTDVIYVCTCVCIAVAQDMLGQATSILTSSVGAGTITAHNKMLQDERMKQGLGNAGLPQMSNDAYTASVTIMLKWRQFVPVSDRAGASLCAHRRTEDHGLHDKRRLRPV